MEKQSPVFRETAPALREQYGKIKTEELLCRAREELGRLRQENAREPRKVRAQTQGSIYPVIALYRAMGEGGIPLPEALDFLDRSCSARAEKKIAPLRKLLKLPGLYRLYPRIFLSVARSQYGRAAGFRAVYYDTGRDRARFDMTRCLYCTVCAREGCPELVPCFCHTDDVNNENLHPRLCWARTRTLGEGGDLCDFDLYVRKEPDK